MTTEGAIPSTTTGEAAGPPRPRLCLRVGVTGHRELDPSDESALKSAVGAALGAIAAAVDALHARHALGTKQGPAYFAAAPRELRFVTAAAAGADIVAGEAAHEAGWSIDCPLPFPAAVYAEDFGEQKWCDWRPRHDALIAKAGGRVFALDGRREAEDRAYEAVGLFVLRRSDILIAVWRGGEGAGRGGSYEILRAAFSAGLPIFWFKPSGAGPYLLWRTEDGPAELRDASAAAEAAPPMDEGAIVKVVDWIVAPPGGEGGKRLRRFFEDESQPTSRWSGFSWLEFVTGAVKKPAPGRVAPFEAATQRDWADAFETAAAPLHRDDTDLADGIRERLRPIFAWADGLAIHYAHIYRSAYVYVFALGALAVLFALLGVFSQLRDIKWMFVATEIVVIVAAAVIVLAGRTLDWHRRFLEYRQLAELLRPWRVLAHVGGVTPALHPPGDATSVEADEQWIGWSLRAAVREIPMPSGAATRERIGAIARTLDAAELKAQLKYQKWTSERRLRLDKGLGHIGEATFFIILGICAGYLAWYAVAALAHWLAHRDLHPPPIVSAWATFATALLPALGGAIFGIREIGAFKENARRAAAMAQRLERLRRRLEALREPTFAALGRVAEDSAEVMAAEVADWAFLYRAKPLTMPG